MSDDRNPYPPPEQPGGTDLPDPPDDPLEDEMTHRLKALDHLYETHQISATELGEARRRILAGLDDEPAPAPPPPPPPPGAGAPPPAAATVTPPPPPGAPTDAAAPASASERGGGIAGIPLWAGIVVAAVVVGAVVIALALILRGGDDDPQPSAGVGAQTSSEYVSGPVAASIDRLNASAVAIGTTLSRTTEPSQVAALRRASERQIEVVEQARRTLSQVAVSEEDRRGHERLVAATAAHRRYLVQLLRASSGTLDQANLVATDRARREGAETQRAYRAFFALVPAAPDAITATDLTDTAGLRSAIETAIAEREAPPAPSPAPPPTPAPPSGTYGGTSFQSPTGNLRCQDQGSQLFCSSSNDGFGVILPEFGGPTTGSGTAPGGGVTVPYGNTWRSGAFSCDSEFDGITCRNRSGNGFFLNRDTFREF